TRTCSSLAVSPPPPPGGPRPGGTPDDRRALTLPRPLRLVLGRLPGGLPHRRGPGHLLLRPPPGGLAGRAGRAARPGRLLPPPGRTPRPRRHRRGLRDRLPLPRLEVRR